MSSGLSGWSTNTRVRESSAPIDLEAGVLGGRADQRDGAVFGGREQAVLLRLVEPVDLVHEQDRLLAAGREPLARLGRRSRGCAARLR